MSRVVKFEQDAERGQFRWLTSLVQDDLSLKPIQGTPFVSNEFNPLQRAINVFEFSRNQALKVIAKIFEKCGLIFVGHWEVEVLISERKAGRIIKPHPEAFAIEDFHSNFSD